MVGEHFVPSPALVERVATRCASERPGEATASRQDAPLVWDHRPVDNDPSFRALCEPNAPLLKRIIRFPATMTPEAPERVQIFDATRETAARAGLPAVPMTFTAHARQFAAPSPIAAIDRDVPPREAPFARARTALREREQAHRSGVTGARGEPR